MRLVVHNERRIAEIVIEPGRGEARPRADGRRQAVSIDEGITAVHRVREARVPTVVAVEAERIVVADDNVVSVDRKIGFGLCDADAGPGGRIGGWARLKTRVVDVAVSSAPVVVQAGVGIARLRSRA